MKNTYKIILMGLVVLGIVYTNAEPDWKKTKDEKYKSIDLCKFPVSIDIGHYVQLKECHKRKIELKQVDCEDIGRGGGDFPCYKGSDVIEVRANFPAIFDASIKKNSSGDDLLNDVNLYWENGIHTIQGTGEWEKLKLCLEVWDVEIWRSAGIIGDVEIGDIKIQVRPPDDTKDDKKEDNTKDQTEDDIGNSED